MKDISVRYGASLALSITIDDATALTATLYVGHEGTAPVLMKSGSFVDGIADLSLDPLDTVLPLGEYNYQINVEYSNGNLDKYPSAENCEDGLPKFTVLDVLDVIPVS